MFNLHSDTSAHSATWAQPIEMLYACHGRVKNFCRQLEILPDYLAEHGIDQAVKNDVKQIITYFNVAAPLHHEDEESDFFPTLLCYAPEAKATILQLEAEHINIHDLWEQLGAQLQELVDEKRSTVSQNLLDDYRAAYERHIALEEPLFELGQNRIPAEELAVMGQIMAERRKIQQ
ncbi:cation-binding protein [Actinobacillus succinogenes]|uniref:Hemerythrin HHE cation binding domain protein n=1 Tax=Actinobacillus succinogenes (strain ATCC 55618 / DSM 22257 / CCUG 43843 / 130Z) TaxID=339671 RepID=A6VN74_ACTSZ|nr:hemerythrin domain-containing protein [Actinobacillus succinogenes]ABR74421.1 Hemerythrin HHE cation binding domain protein [Actinobacillus succinogenes 130Z]PHI41157.1 cation-binding protein [Actinobacillus succinogenes]